MGSDPICTVGRYRTAVGSQLPGATPRCGGSRYVLCPRWRPRESRRNAHQVSTYAPATSNMGRHVPESTGGRGRADRGRQLLRRQLPAVLGLDGRRRGRRRAARARRRRRRRTSRSVSTCTSRSAGSAATSATSASTPTRTRRRSRPTSICWRGSGSCTRRCAAIAGRPLDFVYFGGGTPSFLSTTQLQGARAPPDGGLALVGRAEEITFECEPGTLTEAKLAAIRKLGVTRLSLGVENFDDRILELNGRAHRSPEIGRSFAIARSLGFPQINIDLIAGMLGETDENWRDCIERTLDLDPDSVTIYQMELPYNTTISSDLLKAQGTVHRPGRQLGDEAPLGGRGVRGARARGLSHRQRLHRGQEPGDRRRSSIAIGCGRARTWSASASRRSGTSTACTCRTSTRGRPTARRSDAASSRSPAPIARRPRSA